MIEQVPLPGTSVDSHHYRRHSLPAVGHHGSVDTRTSLYSVRLPPLPQAFPPCGRSPWLRLHDPQDVGHVGETMDGENRHLYILVLRSTPAISLKGLSLKGLSLKGLPSVAFGRLRSPHFIRSPSVAWLRRHQTKTSIARSSLMAREPLTRTISPPITSPPNVAQSCSISSK